MEGGLKDLEGSTAYIVQRNSEEAVHELRTFSITWLVVTLRSATHSITLFDAQYLCMMPLFLGLLLLIGTGTISVVT